MSEYKCYHLFKTDNPAPRKYAAIIKKRTNDHHQKERVASIGVVADSETWHGKPLVGMTSTTRHFCNRDENYLCIWWKIPLTIRQVTYAVCDTFPSHWNRQAYLWQNKFLLDVLPDIFIRSVACLFNQIFYKASHSKGLEQRALHVHQRKTKHIIAKLWATFHSSTNLFEKYDQMLDYSIEVAVIKKLRVCYT